MSAAITYAKRKKLGHWRKKPQNDRKELAAMGRAGFSYKIARQALEEPAES